MNVYLGRFTRLDRMNVFNGQWEPVSLHVPDAICVSVKKMFSVLRNISSSLLTVPLMLPHHCLAAGLWASVGGGHGLGLPQWKGLCLFFLEIFISNLLVSLLQWRRRRRRILVTHACFFPQVNCTDLVPGPESLSWIQYIRAFRILLVEKCCSPPTSDRKPTWDELQSPITASELRL